MTDIAADTALYPPTLRPPPKPLSLLPFLISFAQNPLRSIPEQAYERDILVHRDPFATFAWLCGPELIEKMLVSDVSDYKKSPLERRVLERALGDGVLTSEDQLWRWQRRTMAPLFRHSEILSYVPIMARAGEDQVSKWRAGGALQARLIDVDMSETTFAVIAGSMLDGGQPKEADIIRQATDDFISRISWEMAYAILKVPSWIPHPATWHIRRSAKSMRDAVQRIIARRRQSQQKTDDLLGRLLGARDPDTGKPMSDRQLVNNLLTLLDAGHETTAKALTWALYLLARAPEWQDKVRDEVLQVAGTSLIQAEHIAKLDITTRVLNEAMRLYPPAPALLRAPKVPVTLGGETLPADTQILVPIYCIHRHRKLWQDPDRFDPDRFAPEKKTLIPRTQFMPFGAGPRICIGSAFAMVEGITLLATLVRSTRFDWDGRHKPEPISRITLRPKGGMPLRINPLQQRALP